MKKFSTHTWVILGLIPLLLVLVAVMMHGWGAGPVHLHLGLRVWVLPGWSAMGWLFFLGLAGGLMAGLPRGREISITRTLSRGTGVTLVLLALLAVARTWPSVAMRPGFGPLPPGGVLLSAPLLGLVLALVASSLRKAPGEGS